MNSISAVITGDIVSSRGISSNQKQVLLTVLNETFEAIHERFKCTIEIYRGDSFQGITNRPEEALLIANIIRSSLRRNANNGSLEDHWDARIVIGIGTVDAPAENIVTSDGEAFRLSGEELDRIKKTDHRLRIKTGNEDLNEEFLVSCTLADTIIKRWTTLQAEAIYWTLLTEEKQEQVANRLGISQPAVRKRMNISGNLDAIQLFIHRFRSVIKKTYL